MGSARQDRGLRRSYKGAGGPLCERTSMIHGIGTDLVQLRRMRAAVAEMKRLMREAAQQT